MNVICLVCTRKDHHAKKSCKASSRGSVAPRGHPQKPFFVLSFAIPELQDLASRKISGRHCATTKALRRLNWFLRDLRPENPAEIF